MINHAAHIISRAHPIYDGGAGAPAHYKAYIDKGYNNSNSTHEHYNNEDELDPVTSPLKTVREPETAGTG